MSRRPAVRRFTMVEDWVLLNPEVDDFSFRMYSIMKSALSHSDGGFPDTGIRVSADWFLGMMTRKTGNPPSINTVRRGLKVLLDVGAIRRVHDKAPGRIATYEMVVDPGANHSGPLSSRQLERSQRRNGSMPINAVCHEIPLSGHPAATGSRIRKYKPKKFVASKETAASPEYMDYERECQLREGRSGSTLRHPAAKPVVTPPVIDETFIDDEDMVTGVTVEANDEDDLVVDPAPAPVVRREVAPKVTPPKANPVTPAMAKLAEELEIQSARRPQAKDRLMPGACQRIAAECQSALDRGWDPGVVAQRLLASLNPKIHSPERFLISKVRDLGTPRDEASTEPLKPGEMRLQDGTVVQMSEVAGMIRPQAESQSESLSKEERELHDEVVAKGRALMDQSRRMRAAGLK